MALALVSLRSLFLKKEKKWLQSLWFSSTTLKKDPTLLADFNYFCLGEGGGGEYKRNNNFFQILSDLDSFLNEVSFSPHKFVSHFKPYQEGGKNGIRGAAAHCLWSSSITDL